MSTEGWVGVLSLLVAAVAFYYTFSRRATISCHVGFGYLKKVSGGLEATLEMRLANNSNRPALINGPALTLLGSADPDILRLKSAGNFMPRERKIDGQQTSRNAIGVWLSPNESKVLEEKWMLSTVRPIPDRGVLNFELVLITVGRKGKKLYAPRTPLQAQLPSSALVTEGHYKYRKESAPGN